MKDRRKVFALGITRDFVQTDEAANESDCDKSASIYFRPILGKNLFEQFELDFRQVVARLVMDNNL